MVLRLVFVKSTGLFVCYRLRRSFLDISLACTYGRSVLSRLKAGTEIRIPLFDHVSTGCGWTAGLENRARTLKTAAATAYCR